MVSDTHSSLTDISASHNAFFNVIAELREPRDFPKALALLQSLDISLYLVAGVVIYYFAGDDVQSPALGSLHPTMSKVAYGVALPTVRLTSGSPADDQIIIAGVVNGHIACKSIYTRVFAGTNRIHQRGFKAVGSWIGIAVALWVIAWIIATAIPVFSSLLSLMVCLLPRSNISKGRRHSSPAGSASACRGLSGCL